MSGTNLSHGNDIIRFEIAFSCAGHCLLGLNAPFLHRATTSLHTFVALILGFGTGLYSSFLNAYVCSPLYSDRLLGILYIEAAVISDSCIMATHGWTPTPFRLCHFTSSLNRHPVRGRPLTVGPTFLPLLKWSQSCICYLHLIKDGQEDC